MSILSDERGGFKISLALVALVVLFFLAGVVFILNHSFWYIGLGCFVVAFFLYPVGASIARRIAG